MNSYKKYSLLVLLLSFASIQVQSKWSNHRPFRWFKNRRYKKNRSLLTEVRNHATAQNIVTLIKDGADVNYQNRAGLTALHFAVARNNFDVAKALLENGANPNIKDTMSGLTPIFYALNNQKMLNLLLEHKADSNIQNNIGQTPLIIAVVRNYTEAVKLLVKHNADVTLKDSADKTALDYATKKRNQTMINMLNQQGLKNLIDQN